MPVGIQTPSHLRFMPAIFVLFWATGFIGAKYGLPYAEPLTFLMYRFGIVIALMAGIALVTKAPWPDTPGAIFHSLVSGILIHGVYLGGVFWAIGLGMPAGISALIVGTQPLLTALLSGPLLGERIGWRHWTGIGIGLAGIILVLAPRLTPGAAESLNPVNVSAAIAALFGITLGTIYQKAFATAADLRTGGVVQYTGAAVLVGVGAFFFETMHIEWTGQFIGALAWLVLVLSLGAISLLMVIIRHGEVSRVATLFYLVPPITALIAYPLFAEHLGPVQIAGMALTAYAVWFAGSGHRKR